jgi:hypothetical protein
MPSNRMIERLKWHRHPLSFIFFVFAPLQLCVFVPRALRMGARLALMLMLML